MAMTGLGGVPQARWRLERHPGNRSSQNMRSRSQILAPRGILIPITAPKRAYPITRSSKRFAKASTRNFRMQFVGHYGIAASKGIEDYGDTGRNAISGY